MIKYISPLLFICLIACEFNSAPRNSGTENVSYASSENELNIQTVPTHEIQFVEEAVFHDSEENPILFSPLTRMIVDDFNRVFIGDLQRMIHVFNPDGSFMRTVGRHGNGPGEFQSVTRFLIQNSRLYVFDGGANRMTSFSLETLEYVDMEYIIPQNRGEWEGLRSSPGATPVFVKEDGTFLVQINKTRSTFMEIENPDPDIIGFSRIYSMSADGMRITDMILNQDWHALFEYRISPQYAPYESRQQLYVSEQGNIYSIPYTDEFRIEVYDSSGDTVRTIQHNFENRELTQEDIDEFTIGESLREQLNDVDLPEVWAAIHELVVDDEERLWVSTFVDDDDVYEWWVLQEDGEVTAKFTWPRNHPIEYIRNGYLYAFDDTQADSGLEQYIKYRIDLTAK